jgi:hypothetical protein
MLVNASTLDSVVRVIGTCDSRKELVLRTKWFLVHAFVLDTVSPKLKAQKKLPELTAQLKSTANPKNGLAAKKLYKNLGIFVSLRPNPDFQF